MGWEEGPGDLLQRPVPAAVPLQVDPALGAVHDGRVLLAVLTEDVTLRALRRGQCVNRETGLTARSDVEWQRVERESC